MRRPGIVVLACLAIWCAPALARTYSLAPGQQAIGAVGETTARAGETIVDVARRFTFVPAGHTFSEWQEPRTLPKIMCVYLDPAHLRLDAKLHDAERGLAPRRHEGVRPWNHSHAAAFARKRASCSGSSAARCRCSYE